MTRPAPHECDGTYTCPGCQPERDRRVRRGIRPRRPLPVKGDR